VLAVYADGSVIEMATIGREGCTGMQAFFGAKSSSVRLMVQIPGSAAKMSRAAFARAMECRPSEILCPLTFTPFWSRSWCRWRATVRIASSSAWRSATCRRVKAIRLGPHGRAHGAASVGLGRPRRPRVYQACLFSASRLALLFKLGRNDSWAGSLDPCARECRAQGNTRLEHAPLRREFC
jgi:hypothetical protein